MGILIDEGGMGRGVRGSQSKDWDSPIGRVSYSNGSPRNSWKINRNQMAGCVQ